MLKLDHEFRDPIYGFIKLKSSERHVVDTAAFQRLRSIQQLALTSHVYPGATHKRFEHSLGVMELAGRVFDTVLANLSEEMKERLPQSSEDRDYWRRVVRMAALLHDVGHMPFSHGAEKLLPKGATHEALTRLVLERSELTGILEAQPLRLNPQDVVKIALGKKEAPDLEFSDWETILSEIIVGSSFGTDRMDYLLRDSHHAGVAYGKFDFLRLIECLRILPFSNQGGAESWEPHLGVELGGLFSAEALVMARHWMFSQVYFHPLRIVYDNYLSSFLSAWLGEGSYQIDVDFHLALTDDEVMTAMRQAKKDQSCPAHPFADRILSRRHHRKVISILPGDLNENPDYENELVGALKLEFGSDALLTGTRSKDAAVTDFPVLMPDRRIQPATALSDVVAKAPVAFANYIFVKPELKDKVQRWYDDYRKNLRRSA